MDKLRAVDNLIESVIKLKDGSRKAFCVAQVFSSSFLHDSSDVFDDGAEKTLVT